MKAFLYVCLMILGLVGVATAKVGVPDCFIWNLNAY